MNSINKIKLTWQDIEKNIDILANLFSDKNIDAIISVGRGGMIPARLLAEKLDIHDVYLYNIRMYTNDDKIGDVVSEQLVIQKPNIKNVLFIDDCIFSGSTLKHIKSNFIENNHHINNIDFVFLYKNEYCSVTDNIFYAEKYDGNSNWLVFPWEK